jgi:hypothetical protein
MVAPLKTIIALPAAHDRIHNYTVPWRKGGPETSLLHHTAELVARYSRLGGRAGEVVFVAAAKAACPHADNSLVFGRLRVGRGSQF